jgi:hypothetical protein
VCQLLPITWVIEKIKMSLFLAGSASYGVSHKIVDMLPELFRRIKSDLSLQPSSNLYANLFEFRFAIDVLEYSRL